MLLKKNLWLGIFLSIPFWGFSQTFDISDGYDIVPKKTATVIRTDNYNLQVKSIDKKENGEVKLKGKILNKQNQPIRNAIVFQNNKDDSNKKNTNKAGEFEITLSQAFDNLSIESEQKTSTISLNELEETSNLTGDEEEAAEPETDEATTKLSGVFVANFGEESVIQPNILISQDWEFGNWCGLEMKVMGLVNNKDTLLQTNGLNLIKPEISKFNFRLSADFKPFTNYRYFDINLETNIFRQRLNFQKDPVADPAVVNEDITSLLFRFGMGIKLEEQLSFAFNGVYYNVFAGRSSYEKRFSDKVWKNYLNAEFSGRFYVKQGLLKGAFLQASYVFNSVKFRSILDTQDTGNFFIRLGFEKPVAKKNKSTAKNEPK